MTNLTSKNMTLTIKRMSALPRLRLIATLAFSNLDEGFDALICSLNRRLPLRPFVCPVTPAPRRRSEIVIPANLHLSPHIKKQKS